jgi:sporulation protein YlmC with PRC-barrel domain
MDIPINVEVLCAGELCGRSTCLIVNPIDVHITHLVVIEKDYPYVERLVPVKLILDSSPSSVQLRCTKAAFSGMEPFWETDFISGPLETTLPYNIPYLYWPYSAYVGTPLLLEHKHIPAGEVVIHRGTSVKATDGPVGHVDEFVVDPREGNISHLILREGHLWGKKDVTIPVSEIDKITDEGVYLKLDKKTITALPAVPLHRQWK